MQTATCSYLGNDVAAVVVTQSSGQFIVGHVRSVLSGSPQFRQCFRSNDTELSIPAVPDYRPVVVERAATPGLPWIFDLGVLATATTQQFQQELPELNVTLRPPFDWNCQ